MNVGITVKVAITGSPGNVPVIATFTVIPTFTNQGVSADGPSEEFTITVIPNGQVNQVDDIIVCNGDFVNKIPFTTLNLDLNGEGLTQFDWEIINGVDIGMNPANGLTESTPAFFADNLTNLPTVAIIEVTPIYYYPSLNGLSCPGDPITFTITVNPEPQIDPISEVICSDIGSFDITPVDGTNGIVPVGTTYTWTVDDASNVITGEDAGTGSSISDSDLFNTTSSPADLVYTVTPSTAEGCVGEDFTITITVNPEPQINDVAQTICNDETFTTVDPQDGTNGIVPVGTTYSWGVPVSNPAGAITGGVAGTDESSIVGTQLTNGTSSPAD